SEDISSPVRQRILRNHKTETTASHHHRGKPHENSTTN
ncbi:hypothetical protein PoMZ_09884, partial [Pyricularia oryzae]